MATHAGLANVKSADTTISDDVLVTDALTVSGAATLHGSTTMNGNVAVGNASSDTVGFYGQTPVTRPTSSAQADIVSSASVSISATQYGYATSTQATGIVTLLREIRRVIVVGTSGLGLMSGS